MQAVNVFWDSIVPYLPSFLQPSKKPFGNTIHAPLSSVHAHLNAFHVYANEPTRYVEANHYCAHLTSKVRQCLLYDSASPSARLIGVEYMITPGLYAKLPQKERRLWHSHVFEVKSGMLVMPRPNGVPEAVWEVGEDEAMKGIIELYGKVYHLWQYDRGEEVPMGEPQLMMSLTEEGFKRVEGIEEKLAERDQRFGTNWKAKGERRKGIKEPEIHP
ncbi:hypothetical protein KVT40_000803 [Elsinoe batatas]|uniref:DUF1264-domain-containing protein n=1 Tax=Elsinoe batatas TaxID=2601811 RepID=A0A8K0PLG3_9PEZI|nr:hypothetical protein KVT40_000803 [Elsinoe batatas]